MSQLISQTTTTNVIGDLGLEVVTLTCKRLKRLRIYHGEDDQGLGIEPSEDTQTGLITVAHGFFGFVGETDAGLRKFSRGCLSLRNLEMWICCFTEHAPAIVATGDSIGFSSVMRVQGYRASQMGIVDILEMARPYWNIELILGDSRNYDCQSVRVDHPFHIVAYYLLSGQSRSSRVCLPFGLFKSRACTYISIFLRLEY